ncbi:flavin reductase family protein [Nocardioides daejeonensis]|uniref:flavin reductase family protein n=1 Tax=Nocardioides daejeonensis TaxID=1046556 RepID=UPI000D745096|nr:flavin reductase family protein [Nocardioides daejeonensis]
MTVPARALPLPLTTNQDLDPARLRAAFGEFPSGVVAVAAQVDGAPVGLAASSFTSVSLDPPLVSISVANTSATWPTLRRADHLGVTVLAEHHGLVCRQLAGPVASRFDGVALSVSSRGALTLDDGLVQFTCSVHREVEAGDHTLILLELHGVDRTATGGPLVFHNSAFTQLPSVKPVVSAANGNEPTA